jgi:hypothetical protein
MVGRACRSVTAERLLGFGFEHRLQELAGSIPKLGFNRVESVVEKMFRLDFRLPQPRRLDMACQGVISARRVNAGLAC